MITLYNQTQQDIIKENILNKNELFIKQPKIKINANTRQIDFSNEIVNVQFDHNAETIWFEITRYFDYVDFFEGVQNGNSKKSCIIQYVNAAGQRGFYPVEDFYFSNTDSDIVSFGWKISQHVTKESGDVLFSVRFCEAKENNQDKQIVYNWSTKPSRLTVEEGIPYLLGSASSDGGLFDDIGILISDINAATEKATETLSVVNEKIAIIEAAGAAQITELNNRIEQIKADGDFPQTAIELSGAVATLQNNMDNIEKLALGELIPAEKVSAAYISYSDGTTVSSTAISRTDFIDISKYKQITYTQAISTSTSQPKHGIAFYSEKMLALLLKALLADMRPQSSPRDFIL